VLIWCMRRQLLQPFVCTPGPSTIPHIYPSVLQALVGRGDAGCLERRIQGYYAALSRILQVNFREFLFHALR